MFFPFVFFCLYNCVSKKYTKLVVVVQKSDLTHALACRQTGPLNSAIWHITTIWPHNFLHIFGLIHISCCSICLPIYFLMGTDGVRHVKKGGCNLLHYLVYSHVYALCLPLSLHLLTVCLNYEGKKDPFLHLIS